MYLYRSRSELSYKRENMVRTYSGTISLWFPTCRSCLWSCAGWLPPGSELSSGLRPRAAGEINPQHSLSQFTLYQALLRRGTYKVLGYNASISPGLLTSRCGLSSGSRRRDRKPVVVFLGPGFISCWLVSDAESCNILHRMSLPDPSLYLN